MRRLRMPGHEFMGTRVLVLPGNDVVANIALQCWKSESAAVPNAA